MTVEQLVIAKELDAEIRRVNGVVTDLENITSDLRVDEHDKGCKSAIICIDVDYGYKYKQTPPIPINLRRIIAFLEEQKTGCEEEVKKLNEEFSEL